MGCFLRKAAASSFFFLKNGDALYIACRSCDDNSSKAALELVHNVAIGVFS
jgi:hypothetical protein